jgi:hypothetical protein
MTDFFHELGKAAARQLAQNIDAGRLGELQRSALDNHTTGPMARDSMPTGLGARSYATGPRYSNGDNDMPNNLAPRGGYDQDPDNNGGAPVDAQSCLQMVHNCLMGLANAGNTDEVDSLVSGLMDLLQGEGPSMDEDNGNNGSLTLVHRPNGGNNNGDRRPARDGLPNNNQGALDRQRSRPRARDNAMTRPSAMDRALPNSTMFARRPSRPSPANTQSFLTRFPDAAKIRVLG